MQDPSPRAAVCLCAAQQSDAQCRVGTDAVADAVRNRRHCDAGAMLRVRAAWCQKVGVFDDVYLGLYVCTGKGVGAYVLARLSSAQRTRVVVFRVYQNSPYLFATRIPIDARASTL